MRLRHVAELNPPVHGLTRAHAGTEISFLPLDAVWSDERFDPSRTVEFIGEVQSYNAVAEGDVLVPKVSPTFAHGRTCVARNLVGGRALATSEVFVLRARDPTMSRFLKYRLLASDFLSEGIASWVGVAGLKRVSADFVRDTRIDPSAWQRGHAIADFLDRECSRIRALSAEIILTAAALRSSLVSEQAEIFEPSGQVPLTEDAGPRLGTLVRESDRRSGGVGLPLLSVTINRGVVRRDQLTSDTPRAEDLGEYKRVRKGDIVVNRMRAFQGAVGVAPEDGLVSPDYLVLVTTSDIRADLVAYGLASHRGAELMRSRLRGIGGVANGAVRTPRINASEVLSLRFTAPSRPEQDALVAEIGAKSQRNETLRTELTAFIEALESYRHALITEAVTGKLDVTKLSESQMDESLAAVRDGERPEALST